MFVLSCPRVERLLSGMTWGAPGEGPGLPNLLPPHPTYHSSAMYCWGSTGLQKMWPSRAGVGSLSHRNRVSLVPRLTWGETGRTGASVRAWFHLPWPHHSLLMLQIKRHFHRGTFSDPPTAGESKVSSPDTGCHGSHCVVF